MNVSGPGAPGSDIKMVDLFAGPGGLDVAAQWLGIPTIGIESSSEACATRSEAGLPTDQADVRDRDPDFYPGAKFLAGGPPCQTYSVAGSGAGRDRLHQVHRLIGKMHREGYEAVRAELATMRDARTALVLEPLRWILAAEKAGSPYEAVVLEQVPTVLPLWLEYRTVLRAMGYSADAKVFCAEEYGVPQTRRRAILIAVKDRELVWPVASHQRYVRGQHPVGRKPLPWVSMAQALERKDEFEVVSNYGSGGRSEARGRRRYDEPAYTVTGKVSRNRFVDLKDNYIGHVSIEDAARLQTFPRRFPWSGRDLSQQVGNAIPPRLAAHVLSAAIFSKCPSTESLDAAVRTDWATTARKQTRSIELYETAGCEDLTLRDLRELAPVTA
ncbi:DNA cytosine methyltransferase [Nocardia fluminea]|uniref:DNA cytosine methyltransferase n=1 Tax=Nocardia fluminea TaxID=134984 RepID=UPI003656C5F6